MSWCCCCFHKIIKTNVTLNVDELLLVNQEPLIQTEDSNTTNEPCEFPNHDSHSEAAPKNETYLALYNYMDLKPGDVLESIETNIEKNPEQQWINVRNVNTGSITKAPVAYLAKVTDINDEPWYFSEVLNREEAESILRNADEEHGLFMVRKSSNEKAPFALSVKAFDKESQNFKILHYQISKRDNFYGRKEKEQFVTVSNMIESYLADTDAFLTKPCPKNLGLEVNRDELDIRNEIGRGQFGIVKKGVLRNRNVAIKELILSNATTEDEFMKEIQLMNQFKHKNIVTLYGVCTDKAPYIMVLEFMENGCLLQYLKNKSLSMPENLYIIQQIAEGMEFLEMYKVLHRDLAARNILVGSDLTAKISDFGLSRMLQQQEYYVMTSNTKVPILWMAVESITKSRYTSKSDVWSFGILAMEIFTRGKRPYSEFEIPVREIYLQIEGGLRMTQPQNVPNDIFKKVSACWLTDPKDRPTFSQLNKFFTSYDFK